MKENKYIFQIVNYGYSTKTHTHSRFDTWTWTVKKRKKKLKKQHDLINIPDEKLKREL